MNIVHVYVLHNMYIMQMVGLVLRQGVMAVRIYRVYFVMYCEWFFTCKLHCLHTCECSKLLLNAKFEVCTY